MESLINGLSSLAQLDIVVIVYVLEGSDELNTDFMYNNELSPKLIKACLEAEHGALDIVSIAR